MKHLTPTLIFLALCFQGCSILPRKASPESTQSRLKWKCAEHDLPSCIFSGSLSILNTLELPQQAMVMLVNADGSHTYWGKTDQQGKFIIENIPLGTYRVMVKPDESSGYANTYIDEVQFKRPSTCVADIQAYLKPITIEKPVIYLYPTQTQKVHVQLKYQGVITHSYPVYPENGWEVTAEPNGTLWDENQQEYYALFWEGTPAYPIIPQDGFVVAGDQTAAFLEEKLAYLGLNRREANECIMYWLPRMENNAYNLIHFAGTQYQELAELHISPQPETIIRVMMLTQALSSKINFPQQDLSPLKKTRKGFTVVEWGGAEVNMIIENN